MSDDEEEIYTGSDEEIRPAEWGFDPFAQEPWPELDAPGSAAVINWRTLEDDAAERVWMELRAWVDWLCRRYRISTRKVPACWYRHGAVVEELSALHGSWKLAFDAAEAGNGPIGWHERFVLCLQRLSDLHYSGECSRTEGHQIPIERAPTDDSETWTNWIRTSHGAD